MRAGDPFSSILSSLKPLGCLSGGLEVGGEWAFAFPPDGTFRCFAVMTGRCWLLFADGLGPIRLDVGDYVVLPHGREFSLASGPEILPLNIYAQVGGSLDGRLVQVSGGGGCRLFGAVFSFRHDVVDFFFGSLPPVLHISDSEDRVVLKAYLDRMAALLSDPRPGGELVSERLAETMLIEVLRLSLAHAARAGTGWLFTLSDERLGRAVAAIHKSPGRRWTVRQLAQVAGMSRSAFALRFRQSMGMPAMSYLVRWRILLAADRLVATSDSIGTIADLIGYRSQSAFVSAFRKEMGCSPRQYSKGAF